MCSRPDAPGSAESVLEQLVDRELVVVKLRERLAAGVQIPRFASVISFSNSGLSAFAFGCVVRIRSCSISCFDMVYRSIDLR